jgi:membrane protein
MTGTDKPPETQGGHGRRLAAFGRSLAAFGRPSGHTADTHRGRDARRPESIPLAGWRDIALRVQKQLAEDNLSVVAGGVAFFAMLAIFPALAATVSLYGLVADPADVVSQFESLRGVVPAEAHTLIAQQLTAVTGAADRSLGFGLAFSLGLAIWSATKGVKSLMSALNIVYDEQENRGFFRLNALALLFTTSGVLMVGVMLGLIVGLTALLAILPLPGWLSAALSLLRWPILAAIAIAAFGIAYRFGPSRSRARWQWLSWGAIIGTALWLLASGGFSFYVAHFADYNELYGSLASVIILLMWFYITAYVVLLGAEINSEIEHQTAMDSTTGPDRPMGKRGAYVADTLGEEQ